MKVIDLGTPGDSNSPYCMCELEGRVYPIGGKYPMGVRATADGKHEVVEDSCTRKDVENLIEDARQNSPGGMPPLLLEHDNDEGPIGQVTDMYFKPDGWLYARAQIFSPKQLSSAANIRQKISDKELTGFSIGYDVVPPPPGSPPGTPARRRFVEISAVKEPFFPSGGYSAVAASKTSAPTVPGRLYALDHTGRIIINDNDNDTLVAAPTVDSDKERDYLFRNSTAIVRASDSQASAVPAEKIVLDAPQVIRVYTPAPPSTAETPAISKLESAAVNNSESESKSVTPALASASVRCPPARRPPPTPYMSAILHSVMCYLFKQILSHAACRFYQQPRRKILRAWILSSSNSSNNRRATRQPHLLAPRVHRRFPPTHRPQHRPRRQTPLPLSKARPSFLPEMSASRR